MADDVTSEAVIFEKEHDGPIALRTVPLGESKQPEDSEAELWTPQEAIRPPENLEALARLSRESWVRSSCIDAITLNTVGLGYSVEVAKGHEDEGIKPERLHEAEQPLEALASRNRRLEKPSFTNLLGTVKKDEEECGNGAL